MKNIYYTIGQVSSLLDLPQSVLRYWETVFDSLSPAKSPGGSRQYSEEDIELVRTIKSLLYEQGFTIKGAVVKLKNSDDKRNFLINFWEARGEAQKNRHYQLVELANKKYSTFNKQGWQTDRGRVLIKYGVPDEVETYTMQPLTPAHTIWRYFGLKGYFIFAETSVEGDLMLVDSNVAGEIYDPKWKAHTDDLIKGRQKGYFDDE